VMEGVYCEFPLLTSEGQCLWPGKYKNEAAIEAERRRIGNISAWHREYLLHILPDHDRLIHRDWIRYYKDLPVTDNDFPLRLVATGIDLAISQNDSADNTAMVSGVVYGRGKDMCIYILPNPVNERLTFLETIDRAKDVAVAVSRNGERTVLHVEDVGYQHALIEELERDGLNVVGVPTKGQDKRARLALITHLIQSGRVLFALVGCETLITQLVGFGSERYDDLADALAILLLPILPIQGSNNRGFTLGELNGLDDQPPKHSADERKFWYPDHSDDRDSGCGTNWLDMQW